MKKREFPTAYPFLFMLMLMVAAMLPGAGQLSAQAYTVNGSASNLGGSCYQLTPNAANQAGSIFRTNTISLNQAFSIRARLNFGCQNNTGADGIAFVFATTNNPVGGTGGDLGYEGVTPSLAVQMDDFQNGDASDPAEDHFAILKNGSVNHNSANNLAGPVNLPNLENCNDHCFMLDWNPATQTLVTSIDGVGLSYTGNIVADIFGGNPNVYAGFSSATGTLFNPHTVCFSPPPLVEMTDVEVCPGDSVVLQPDPNGIAFNWEPSPVLSATNIANPTAHGLYTTLLFVDITYACGFTNNDAVVLTVLPLPGVSVSSNSPVCEGKDLKLFAGGVDGFQWSGPGMFSSTAQNPVIAQATSAQSGAYHVNMNSANGCKAYLSVEVTVKPAANTSQTITICANETADIFGTPTNSPGVYQKDFPGSNGDCDSTHTITLVVKDTFQTSQTVAVCENETADIFGVPTNLPGDYLMSFPSSTGCDSTHTIHLVVKETAHTSETVTICGNETADVFGVPTNSPGDYTKVFQGFNGCDSTHVIHLLTKDTVATQETISICQGDSALVFGNYETQPGTYAMTFQGGNGCDSTHVVTLVGSMPFTLGLTTKRPCPGVSDGEITVNVTGGGPGFVFDWGTLLSNSGALTGLPSGAYSLTVTDAAGCSATIATTLEDLPDFSFATSATPVKCFGEATGAVAVTGTSGLSYSLDGTDFQAQPAFENLEVGNYTLFARSPSGCMKTAGFEITAPPPPGLQMPPDVTIESGDTLTIQPTTSSNNPQFSWTPDSTLSCGDCPNPVAQPQETTLYRLTITDTAGCQQTDSMLVTVELVLNVKVPNVFTPNNDGLNDWFTILGKGISEVRHLRIYDRWGKQVYEGQNLPAKDKTAGWDGTVKGTAAASDVYVYYGVVRFVDGSEKVVKGDLTLVR